MFVQLLYTTPGLTNIFNMKSFSRDLKRNSHIWDECKFIKFYENHNKSKSASQKLLLLYVLITTKL